MQRLPLQYVQQLRGSYPMDQAVQGREVPQYQTVENLKKMFEVQLHY
jgi:hypothetical protein